MYFFFLLSGYNTPVVEITPRGSIAIRTGESLTIMCRVGQPVMFCRVESPVGQSMILQPGVPNDHGIEYFGDGLQSGQCGVRIKKVTELNDGEFKCGLTINGSQPEATGKLRIIVASKLNLFYYIKKNFQFCFVTYKLFELIF